MSQTELQRSKAKLEFERRRKLASEQAAIRQQALQAAANAPLHPAIPFSLTIASVVFAMLCLIPFGVIGVWLWLTHPVHTGQYSPFNAWSGMVLGPTLMTFFGGGAVCMKISVTCSAVALHKSERYVKFFNLALITIVITPYLLGGLYLLFLIF